MVHCPAGLSFTWYSTIVVLLEMGVTTNPHLFVEPYLQSLLWSICCPWRLWSFNSVVLAGSCFLLRKWLCESWRSESVVWEGLHWQAVLLPMRLVITCTCWILLVHQRSWSKVGWNHLSGCTLFRALSWIAFAVQPVQLYKVIHNRLRICFRKQFI